MTSATIAQTQAYRKTIPGLCTMIYANQKMTSKKAGRPPPQYTKQEFVSWLLSQPHFQTLFDNWVSSGHQRNLSPSVDRIDNKRTYALGNIQLVTWKQNRENQKLHQMSGELRTHNMRFIDQLDLNGIYIRTFHSVQEAMRCIGKSPKSGTNVASVCNGKLKTAYGYRWRWATLA